MTRLIQLESFGPRGAAVASRPVLDRLKSLETTPAEPHVVLPALGEGEQYRFHFDMTRCIGCRCCEVACNEQNNNPAHVTWRRVGEIEGGEYPHVRRFHVSMACNHCAEPTCLDGCPVDAYTKLENGIVRHDAETCIGCQYCTWTCPYGVPQYHPERRVVTKCHMCVDRIGAGDLPACVEACPTTAIQIEKVHVAEWMDAIARGTAPAGAPGLPPADITSSTTRLTLPEGLPASFGGLEARALQPEDPHWPLVFLLVLSQWSVGLFGAALLLALASPGPAAAQGTLRAWNAVALLGLLVGGAGLAASAFHLGRPAHALRAVKGWRHSWLSREAIAFLVFAVLGGLAAGAAVLSRAGPGGAALGLLAAAVASGLVGVHASTRIYLLRARPAWNTWRTPAQFFGTVVLLGAAGGLAVLSAIPGGFEPGRTPVPWALAGAVSLSGLILALLPWTLIASEPGAGSAVRDTARLLTIRFQKLLWLRTAALLVVAILAPLSAAPVAQPLLSAGVLALALLSEGASRYLFFVTVVPLDIPGHFFDVKSRHRLETQLP